MPIIIMGLFKNMTFVVTLKIIFFILTAIFIVYYFSREGKDERGRGIIGIWP